MGSAGCRDGVITSARPVDSRRERALVIVVVGLLIVARSAIFVFWEQSFFDSDQAVIGLMAKHRALEDTIKRARHYGAIAKDALALFPDSRMKDALADTVEFCIARAH